MGYVTFRDYGAQSTKALLPCFGGVQCKGIGKNEAGNGDVVFK